MANKRPAGKDFDTPPVPLKQPHLEGHIVFPAGTGVIPLATPISHALSPVARAVESPGYISIPAIYPTTPRVEFGQHATPTITVPSGIIPLATPTHGGHSSVGGVHFTALAGAAPLIRPLISQPTTVADATSSTAPLVPDAPPPPYPAAEVVGVSEEFSCSSPSQFLHSPTSVQPPALPTGEGKLDQSPSKQLMTDGIRKLRLKELNVKKSKMMELKLSYEKMLLEKFFLEAGGNMMDYLAWRRKPNILRDQYMKQHDLDSDIISYGEELLSPRDHIAGALIGQETPLDFDTVSTRPSTHHHHLRIPTIPKSSSATATTPTSLMLPMTPASSVTSPTPSLTLSSPRHRSHSTLSVTEVSHEDIVMRARQEAEVMKAISELRKEGLWSSTRLPKVQEPLRIKTHWDYLLEEMQWLATDFANERRWKVNAAKKLSRTVSRHHQEKEIQLQRAQKDEQMKLRKIASTMAKEVKHFWDSIQKIVEHKQQTLLDEKRKRAMDVHLNFIVDQTQKYSSWLMQGLATPTDANSISDPSLVSATASKEGDSDDLFTPVQVDESDDEETIEKEESIALKEGELDHESELSQLQKDSEMPLDELLASLPPGMLEETLPPQAITDGDAGDGDKERTPEELTTREKGRPRRKRTREDTDSPAVSSKVEKHDPSDEEYRASESEGVEDDSTLLEQEQHEQGTDYTDELSNLQQEGEMPIEELLKRYKLQRESATPETDIEESVRDDGDEESDMECGDSGEDGDQSASEDEGEEGMEEGERKDTSPLNVGDAGLEFLVQSANKQSEVSEADREKGLKDVAAAAQELQPKGITLSTTEVKTKVPILLKHTLREYQHIGLDWLVTMHERHLNGILADEMGLGKTIQTIALLAHLACDKGNWGPHLIIVPTSVMLNWEYEFKKWCPGFKIITYFGSYKERKQKRVGWSKYNAFHVCVTSYNIAVQDHRAFKQKRWKYLVLDEAQNIKNFKSQRWQTLLTFNSQHRLLLTGTPLQNNLMELWSLMHFLMPAVFSSHSDFKEWFSNPLTGMVEGSQEYNESIIHRLHQVLRPFLLRRLKMEVEKQLPNKYEHIVVCRLSKRQRYLYEDYMSRAKTKETLSTGSYLSVINVLMQLRKVCNHPDLFEPRPVVSPFRMAGILYTTASLILTPLHYDPFKHVSLDYLNLCLTDYEVSMEAFVAYRSHQLQALRSLMVESSNDLTSCGTSDTEDYRMETQECFDDLSTSAISSRRTQWTISRHEHLYEANAMRCRKRPVYGTDLIKAMTTVTPSDKPHPPKHTSSPGSHWLWSGYSACKLEQCIPERQSVLLNCLWLKSLCISYSERASNMMDVLKRFVITTPKASSPQASLHVSHPHPSDAQRTRHTHDLITNNLTTRPNLFHEVATRNCLQFPETRLIQYDCGKLQTLDVLLRRLKSGSHRALIFTQMARMLDVLEIFLTYHGHTYLRLDGATPVHKRQMLMTRFNKDSRVFCFILSTRSGGLGVNLTGADTVVFYDSDWNPTMDAQAQDRCHRIGQTKDVHIYRLVCESTVEENILKKANQKRMLGDIAIEGGAFTTEFFKKNTIQGLFSVDEEGEEPIVEGHGSVSTADPNMSQKQLEELLLQAEEDNDVEAAKRARAEQAAELAEFDEQFLDNQQQQGSDKLDAQYSRVLEGFASLESQLSGVELYAMKFLEAENAEVARQQLLHAEASIEQAKKDWELSHLQQLREQEERMAREEEEEEEAMSLTYDRPELVNKIMIDEETGEEMPIWLPPTPPSDDSVDYYNDVTLAMSYDLSTTMTPDVLSSVAMYSDDDYDVFGLFKPHTAELTIEPTKKSHKSAIKMKRENIAIPQSLFWRRYTPDLLTTRIRKLSPQTKKVKAKSEQFTPLLEAQEGPEWLVSEDWILIKGLTAALEFPLSLAATVPAQMPNWSILADLVCSLSKNKRSPLQSKDHLVGVIIPREEQIHSSRSDDFEIRKQKGREAGFKKHKGHREQRTRSLMLKDRGKEMTKQFSQCFNWITIAASKRVMQSKQRNEVASMRSSMHNELLLKEYEINLDNVRSPMQLAQLRAERIQSEIPRGSQVPQLHSHALTQSAYTSQLGRQYNSQTLTKIASPAAHLPASVSQLAQRLQASISSGTTSPTTLPTTVQSADTSASLPSKTPQPQSSVTTSTNSPATSQIAIITTSSVPPTSSTATVSNAAAMAAAVAKTYHGVDITKGILLGSRLTPQQLILLKQTALQQQQLQKQQQQHQASQAATTATSIPAQSQIQRQSSQIRTPPMTAHLQTSTVQPQTSKVQIPSGIEQLRSSITLSSNQRGLVRGSGSGGLPTRSMQTEEVLALLKQQQAIRMATARLVNQSQASATVAQTTQLTEAIAAAAAIAAVSKQTPKPSIVTPAESMKSSERAAEASQLKVELVEHPQATTKQPPEKK